MYSKVETASSYIDAFTSSVNSGKRPGVDAAILVEVVEAEPLSEELGGEAARLRIGRHAPRPGRPASPGRSARRPRRRGAARRPGSTTTGRSSSGWPSPSRRAPSRRRAARPRRGRGTRATSGCGPASARTAASWSRLLGGARRAIERAQARLLGRGERTPPGAAGEREGVRRRGPARRGCSAWRDGVVVRAQRARRAAEPPRAAPPRRAGVMSAILRLAGLHAVVVEQHAQVGVVVRPRPEQVVPGAARGRARSSPSTMFLVKKSSVRWYLTLVTKASCSGLL